MYSFNKSIYIYLFFLEKEKEGGSIVVLVYKFGDEGFFLNTLKQNVL